MAVMNDFEKLIEEKKVFDRKQRKVTIWIVSISMIAILIVFYLVTRTKKINETLTNKLDMVQVAQDSLTQKLSDTLRVVSRELKSNIIECIGRPTGTRTSNGLPKYNFIMMISDSSIIPTLDKVEYYFADNTYNPKLKVSNSAEENFRIFITNSWGCMNIVPVYLYHKNNTIDTILFPMCEKAKLDLPEIK